MDSDSEVEEDVNKSASTGTIKQEDLQSSYMIQQISKLGLPVFSAEINAKIESDDFWNLRTNSESQIAFIRELAEFYYFKLVKPLSIKLDVKAYEYIVRYDK